MIDQLLTRFAAVVDELEELPFDRRTVHKMRRLMLVRVKKLR